MIRSVGVNLDPLFRNIKDHSIHLLTWKIFRKFPVGPHLGIKSMIYWVCVKIRISKFIRNSMGWWELKVRSSGCLNRKLKNRGRDGPLLIIICILMYTTFRIHTLVSLNFDHNRSKDFRIQIKMPKRQSFWNQKYRSLWKKINFWSIKQAKWVGLRMTNK